MNEWEGHNLLPTGSDKRELLEAGSTPVAILPSINIRKLMHYDSIVR